MGLDTNTPLSLILEAGQVSVFDFRSARSTEHRCFRNLEILLASTAEGVHGFVDGLQDVDIQTDYEMAQATVLIHGSNHGRYHVGLGRKAHVLIELLDECFV